MRCNTHYELLDDESGETQGQSMRRGNALRHHDYTVAWICALPVEMAAARAVLDEVHGTLPMNRHDSNSYIMGRIGQRNVVIACLPSHQYGLVNAAVVATNLRRTFDSIDITVMVGIGGGAPGTADLRLGDVVVGTRVMQSDLGKFIGGDFQRTAFPRFPPVNLCTLVSTLRAKLGFGRMPAIMHEKFGKYPEYGRPKSDDRLFRPTYEHSSCASTCDSCDTTQQVSRRVRKSKEPEIHYGAIASASQLMRDAVQRDQIGQELGIMCFEMEAAGIVDVLPCLVIRGICDYSDSHKNKIWQRYAAATAAAYARELLEECHMPAAGRRLAPSGNTQVATRQCLLERLTFDEIKVREETIKEAHANTCRWITEHASYKAWLDVKQAPEHRGFLWIRGKPGAGKSTIMKHTLSKFKPPEGRESITLAFFFNARGEHLERSVVGMYRSLLYHLLEKGADLPMDLDQADGIGHEQTGCPSLTTLKKIFRTAVLSLGARSLTCFIDALDESDEQEIIEMIQYFEDLANISFQKGIRFRVCFSSRHYPYIDIPIGERLILESLPQHKQDLARYVHNKLRIGDPHIKETMQAKILEKAGSVFLWVVLVVDILNTEYRRGAMALETRLAEIPRDLSDLFKNILGRDQSNASERDNLELRLCLLWILFAKRPLSPQEFDHALWSGLQPKGFVDDAIPDTATRYRNGSIERLMISSSKGLAELTRSKSPTVQFVHESVRDFLIKDKGLALLWPDLGYESFDRDSLCHEQLRSCCYSYLCHRQVRAVVNESEGEEDKPNTAVEKFPFLDYASQHVLYHANAAAPVVPQDDFVSLFLTSGWVRTLNLFQKRKIRRYKPHTSPLYALADQGLENLVRLQMKRESAATIPGERYQHPFFAALINGHRGAVAALLGLPSINFEGSDITEGLVYRENWTGFKGHTPLSWAVVAGKRGIAMASLQNGADPNEPDKRGCTLVLRALQNKHEDIARLLVEKGAAVDFAQKDMEGTTPLIEALRSGLEAMARLLVDKGANVNARNALGEPPLIVASCSCSEAMVRLLIEKGADVNAQDSKGDPLLTSALMNRREAVARLLIENGADVNAQDNIGEVPLMHGVRSGQETMARLLIKKGANVNTPNTIGDTPLTLASWYGYERVVRLLIDKGADINFQKLGWTALTRNGREAIVRLLIQKGADVNAQNSDGRTACINPGLT